MPSGPKCPLASSRGCATDLAYSRSNPSRLVGSPSLSAAAPVNAITGKVLGINHVSSGVVSLSGVTGQAASIVHASRKADRPTRAKYRYQPAVIDGSVR